MPGKSPAIIRYGILFLLSAVLLSVMSFYFVNFLKPKYQNIKDQITLKREELVSAQKTAAKIELMKEKNEEVKADLSAVKKGFETEVRYGANYFFIGRYADENSVVITEIIPKQSVTKEACFEIPVHLSVRGKYADVMSFIKCMEQNMPDTTNLSSISITSVHKDDGKEFSQGKLAKDPDILAEMEMVTYLVKSPKSMQIAEQWSLGRFDVFSPAADISGLNKETTGSTRNVDMNGTFLKRPENQKESGQFNQQEEVTISINEYSMRFEEMADDVSTANLYCFPQEK